MVDPRAMASMLGYVMKPNMIKRFENDPEAYQQFLNKTQKMRKELLMKMFDYYETLKNLIQS